MGSRFPPRGPLKPGNRWSRKALWRLSRDPRLRTGVWAGAARGRKGGDRPEREGAAVAVGLVYSEMQAAAQAVADAVEPLQTTLQELGATIETEAGKGFKGQAAAGFGEAVNEWFDVAVTLGPILDGYAQSLMYVAQEHATNDVAQAERA